MGTRSSGMRDLRGRLGRLTEVVRAGDWWAYKIAPIMATGFATADLLGASPITLWRSLLLQLLALVLVAVFASVINDRCDLAEDRIASKRNQLEGMPAGRIAALFAACLVPGVALVVWLVTHSPGAAALYLANWFGFVLYSVPPIRLKSRALLGVLAIALGESFLPHLFVVLMTASAASRPVPPLWIALIAVWSFAVGMRSILWHQLRDHEADQQAGVQTLAVAMTPERVQRLGRWFVFPVELAAYLGLLSLLNLGMAWALLGVYALSEWVRYQFWGVPVVVVTPAPGDRLVLYEYYDLFAPVAFVAGAILQDATNGILLVIVVLSTKRAVWWCHDARTMVEGLTSWVVRPGQRPPSDS